MFSSLMEYHEIKIIQHYCQFSLALFCKPYIHLTFLFVFLGTLNCIPLSEPTHHSFQFSYEGHTICFQDLESIYGQTFMSTCF